MSHAWRDVLITSRTDIKLRGGGAANVAHNERFAVGPFSALDCLGTDLTWLILVCCSSY